MVDIAFSATYIAAQTFNLITHEEFNGDGSHIRQESQYTAPPPEAQILPEQSYGRRDKPTRGILYSTRSGSHIS